MAVAPPPLPWLITSPLPWQADQPLYPRLVTIKRSRDDAVSPTGQVMVGLLPYEGREQSTAPGDPDGEDTLYSGLPAAIQLKAIGKTKGGNAMPLPGDYIEKPQWTIFIPASDTNQYDIKDRDVVYDDEGYRYGITANYWTAFGYEIAAIRLEA